MVTEIKERVKMASHYERNSDEDSRDAELILRSPLGRWLWQTRRANNLSQKRLAKMAKTTPEIIDQLETDTEIVTKICYDSDYGYMRAVLIRIATVLELPPISLLTFLE
jgi:hypothetical protein